MASISIIDADRTKDHGSFHPEKVREKDRGRIFIRKMRASTLALCTFSCYHLSVKDCVPQKDFLLYAKDLTTMLPSFLPGHIDSQTRLVFLLVW